MYDRLMFHSLKIGVLSFAPERTVSIKNSGVLYRPYKGISTSSRGSYVVSWVYDTYSNDSGL